HPPDAVAFLRRMRRAVKAGGDAEADGGILIGVDIKKDRATLERAYDDALGVTGAFNKNLLLRINRELGADFDLAAWAHRARYDEALGRIEMHLVSRRAQQVEIDGVSVSFDAGETIRTEESYKYSLP